MQTEQNFAPRIPGWFLSPPRGSGATSLTPDLKAALTASQALHTWKNWSASYISWQHTAKQTKMYNHAPYLHDLGRTPLHQISDLSITIRC